MRPHLSALEPARGACVCWRALETSPPSHPSGLAELYRFALLLTGHAKTAEQVLGETLAATEAHLDQVRSETGRQAWLVQAIRERCLKNNEAPPAAAPRLLRTDAPAGTAPAVLPIEAFLLAQRFHALPEPERSALAIFYLDFFTITQIAELLKMDLETLADTLTAGRTLLRRALHPAEDATPS